MEAAKNFGLYNRSVSVLSRRSSPGRCVLARIKFSELPEFVYPRCLRDLVHAPTGRGVCEQMERGLLAEIKCCGFDCWWTVRNCHGASKPSAHIDGD